MDDVLLKRPHYCTAIVARSRAVADVMRAIYLSTYQLGGDGGGCGERGP